MNPRMPTASSSRAVAGLLHSDEWYGPQQKALACVCSSRAGGCILSFQHHQTNRAPFYQNSGQGRLGYARMHGVLILHLREWLATTFRDSTGFPFGLPTGDEKRPLCVRVEREPECELHASL